MRKICSIAAIAAGLAIASPVATAQMAKERRIKRPFGKMKFKARKVTPDKAQPGARVTVMGRGFRPGMMIRVGSVMVKPQTITPRSITFVLPAMTAGVRPVSVVLRRRTKVAGQLNVLRAEGTPPKVTPDTRPPPPRHHRRHRRWARYRKRPVVTRFYPRRGKPGTKVVVRGMNFTKQSQVMFNRRPVKVKTLTGNLIIFKVPRGAKGDGLVTIRHPRMRRPIIVGRFDLKKRFDKAAEARRRDVMRKAARARWMARRARMAKTREARERRYRERWKRMQADRAERRRKRLAAMRARWKATFLADPQVRAELLQHAERTARLRQMLRLASIDSREKLAIRIQLAITREDRRHKRRMDTLKATFSVSAGGPQ